jgi:hypothetical protein
MDRPQPEQALEPLTGMPRNRPHPGRDTARPDPVREPFRHATPARRRERPERTGTDRVLERVPAAGCARHRHPTARRRRSGPVVAGGVAQVPAATTQLRNSSQTPRQLPRAARSLAESTCSGAPPRPADLASGHESRGITHSPRHSLSRRSAPPRAARSFAESTCSGAPPRPADLASGLESRGAKLPI